MIDSLKAISIGMLSILILGLISQLLLIMAAVGYNSLIKWSEFFVPWSSLFNYFLAFLGIFISMTAGGMITAMVSRRIPCTNAIIAALLGSVLSLYLSLQQEIFTPLALVFLIFALACSILGCRLWFRFQNHKQS